MPPEDRDRDPGWVGRLHRQQRAAATGPTPSSARATNPPIQQHPNFGAWTAALECGVKLADADQLIASMGPQAAERLIRENGPAAIQQADAIRYWKARGVDPDADTGTIRLAEAE